MLRLNWNFLYQKKSLKHLTVISDTASLLLKPHKSDLSQALVTSSANQILMFNDRTPSGPSDCPVLPPTNVMNLRMNVRLSEKKMAAALTAEPNLVASLLKTHFSRRTYGDKREITEKGRRTPKMNSLTKASKGFVGDFKD